MVIDPSRSLMSGDFQKVLDNLNVVLDLSGMWEIDYMQLAKQQTQHCYWHWQESILKYNVPL